ncbi:MAG: segregation/condensation protein A [Patescibacteria group bacterium]
MSFSVEQEGFSGPLALLLEVIEGKNLPITKVSLAKVADEYLAYLETHDVPSDELADFLVIAARLIYLKSCELMPYLRIDEEDAAAAKLEDQLRLYQEFVAAAVKLEERYMVKAMFVRPTVRERAGGKGQRFLPARNISIDTLRDAFGSILKRLEPFFTLQETSMERTKSVEERIDELKSVLETRANLRFRDVIAGAGTKREVVVSFLALLELLRRRHLTAKQESHGTEIHLERLDV